MEIPIVRYAILVVFLAHIIIILFLNKPKIKRGGTWLLLVSMLGSLLFGLVYHVLIPGSDNISTVIMHEPLLDGAVFFTSTAILLVIVDGVGSWVGARATVWWLKVIS